MKKFAALLLLSVFAFAKDKPAEDPKPIFTADEKAPVLVLQRDAGFAKASALPSQMFAEQAERRAHDAWDALLKTKGIDPTKWKCDELKFDCVAVVQPKPEMKPDTQEKK